jgi:5'-methylthioadenosine phosphorylase
LLPREIPARANIYAIKLLGVEHIIAINSCGSFKDEIKPGELLVPDQVIDRTQGRINTFFGDGVVFHISFAEPFCADLSKVLYESAKAAGAGVHLGGTYIAMEGPAFSTRAESCLYKSWGADVIGMTVLPEAKLAREAELCYASLCLVTDYDSWKERETWVTAEVILGYMQRNLETAKRIIKLAVGRISQNRNCECSNALADAMFTTPNIVTLEQKKKYNLLIGKYV